MPLDLNSQFKKALEIMQNSDQHLFLTGKAGTGKSTLLSYFIENSKNSFAVLAPTGVAAINVQGQTIHSFFQFKPNITIEEAKKKGSRAQDNELYTKLKTIIIDEVSMVRADLIDCIDVFLKSSRASNQAFGGVQMIFVGDLYQLPPVVTREDKEYFEVVYKSPYFFDSNVFKEPGFCMEFVELETVYRQKDKAFINLLNAIRTKTITNEHIQILNKQLNPEFEGDSDDYIHLTTTNKMAANINELRLNQLDTKPHFFEGVLKGEMKSPPTDVNLHLKVGSQVMFINNDSAGQWVNGTIGKITDIEEGEVWVKIHNGKEVHVTENTWDMYKYFFDKESKTLSQESAGSFTQIPIKLAWAITIHKSQGKTFDNVIIDLGRGSFAHGQTYVALSRCTTFEGIVLKNPIKTSDILLDWRVQKFITDYQ
jgi:ATP-dependent DNA helicase PIF1